MTVFLHTETYGVCKRTSQSDFKVIIDHPYDFHFDIFPLEQCVVDINDIDVGTNIEYSIDIDSNLPKTKWFRENTINILTTSVKWKEYTVYILSHVNYIATYYLIEKNDESIAYLRESGSSLQGGDALITANIGKNGNLIIKNHGDVESVIVIRDKTANEEMKIL